MNYKQSYFILRICVLGGFLLTFIGLSLANVSERLSVLLSVTGVFAMLGGILQALFFYKCPKCGRRFEIRAQLPSYCPSCGQYLEPYAQSTAYHSTRK